MDLTLAVPTLNALPYLGEALASARRAYPQVRLVVVDSGSTDGTAEVAREAGAEIRHCPPGNLYAAVNAGLADARTPWVGYLNADDRIEAPLSACDGAEVLYGDQRFIDGSGAQLYRWQMSEPMRFGPLVARGVMPFYFQGTLVRRERFTALGGFDTRYRWCADFDLALRLWRAGARLQRQAVVAGAFRLHGAQLTQSRGAAMRAEVLESIARSGVQVPRWRQELALVGLRWRNRTGLWQRWRAHGGGVPRTTSVPVASQAPQQDERRRAG